MFSTSHLQNVASFDTVLRVSSRPYAIDYYCFTDAQMVRFHYEVLHIEH